MVSPKEKVKISSLSMRERAKLSAPSLMLMIDLRRVLSPKDRTITIRFGPGQISTPDRHRPTCPMKEVCRCRWPRKPFMLLRLLLPIIIRITVATTQGGAIPRLIMTAAPLTEVTPPSVVARKSCVATGRLSVPNRRASSICFSVSSGKTATPLNCSFVQFGLMFCYLIKLNICYLVKINSSFEGIKPFIIVSSF